MESFNEKGGSEVEVRARVKAVRAKWRELAEVMNDKKMPKKLKAKVYKVMIRPVLLTSCTVQNVTFERLLLYAAPLFSYLPALIETKLEKFQRRAHRLICGELCDCVFFPPLQGV